MSAYIAVYYGISIEEAQMVAVSADPRLLAYVTGEMLEDEIIFQHSPNPVASALDEGRRNALHLIQQEATQ